MPDVKSPTAPMRGRSAAVRRRDSDDRKRLAGCVRVSVWVPAERLADLVGLSETWGFSGRSEAIDVAVRWAVKRSLTALKIEL